MKQINTKYKRIKQIISDLNLPKSENTKQPQCPEEKEKAINGCIEVFWDDLK